MHDDREAGAFAETLINAVDGKANIVQQPDMASVAELRNYATSVDDLIDKVFPNFQVNVVDSDWLPARGILATLMKQSTKLTAS